jgi:hypothetical protein
MDDVAKLALDDEAAAGFFRKAMENERARQLCLQTFKEEAKVFKQRFESIVNMAVNAGYKKDVLLATWKRLLLLEGMNPDDVELLKHIEAMLPKSLP